MKFILFLACLVLYVANTQAQRICRGGIPPQHNGCLLPKNEGHDRDRFCARDANGDMWWYDRSDNTCKPLTYRGCNGNNNRYCTLQACRNRCIRRE